MQLYLLLNNDCNLNCSFCIRGRLAKHNYINMDNLRLVLNNNDFSEYYLLLTGGEPTLHPQLPDIIDLCQPFFKGISINTNGVDSSWINRCKNNRFHVQISIDGTKTIHNQLRGNGKIDVYNYVVETISILNNYGINYNISTTVGKNNYDNIKEMCNHISALPRVKYWKLSPVLPFGCADDNNVISIEKWNELVDFLLDNAEVRLQIKRLFDFNLLDKHLNNHPEIINFSKTNCGNVKYKVYVYPDFTVYPCTCLTDFPLGNLLSNNLNDIISNESSKIFRDYSVNKNSVCYNCKYLSICNGGCIGMSYHYYNKLGEGDYRCPLIQEKHHII